MDNAKANQVLPTAEIINSELFIGGDKFVLNADYIADMCLYNKGGKIRVKLTVDQSIGNVGDMANEKRED